MVREAILGNANLLQLAEALSLNAERVQFNWNFSGFGGRF